ncbi:MAG: CBS domain containing-hemolysin-like protein [Saprospiraceae bacterium]|jgi:CBS domain containing-hemolysin-like protein
MILLGVYFVLSILFSFLCSVWEAVLLSITPSYIASQPADSQLSEDLKEFKKDIDRPLSAILTLNTIAHTVGAIMVGVQASKVFSDGFSIGPINGEALVAGIMTIAILILSEIIPKTYGANSWRSLVPFTVRSLKFLLMVLAPFVWLSQLITKKLKKDKEMSVLSRADFHALTTAGEQSGALKTAESLAIRNLLRLDQITVESIMTPRAVMFSANGSSSLKELYDGDEAIRYSRIPVFDDKREDIIGVLLKDDLLKSLYDGKGGELVKDHIGPVIFVKQSDSLAALQAMFMKGNNHLAVVVDDFGALLGLVSMEDLFETILGLEILDETDEVADLQKHARELWEKRAAKIGIKTT